MTQPVVCSALERCFAVLFLSSASVINRGEFGLIHRCEWMNGKVILLHMSNRFKSILNLKKEGSRHARSLSLFLFLCS